MRLDGTKPYDIHASPGCGICSRAEPPHAHEDVGLAATHIDAVGKGDCPGPARRDGRGRGFEAVGGTCGTAAAVAPASVGVSAAWFRVLPIDEDLAKLAEELRGGTCRRSQLQIEDWTNVKVNVDVSGNTD